MLTCALYPWNSRLVLGKCTLRKYPSFRVPTQGSTLPHLSFLCDTLVKKALAKSSLLAVTSGLFVEKLLTKSSLLLLASSLLVKKLLTMGLLIKEALAGRCLEAVVLVHPQFVNRPLPILVGAFCAGPKKNGPPGQVRRQQASGMLVFAKCWLEPFLVAKGTNNIGQGIVFLTIVKHPVGGSWGRLWQFVLQPPRRVGEGG
jgi:hypothetical protein